MNSTRISIGKYQITKYVQSHNYYHFRQCITKDSTDLNNLKDKKPGVDILEFETEYLRSSNDCIRLSAVQDDLYSRNTLPISLDTCMLDSLLQLVDIKPCQGSQLRNNTKDVAEDISFNKGDTDTNTNTIILPKFELIREGGKILSLCRKLKQKFFNPLNGSRIKFHLHRRRNFQCYDDNVSENGSTFTISQSTLYHQKFYEPRYSLKRTDTDDDPNDMHSFLNYSVGLSDTTQYSPSPPQSNTTTRSTNVLAILLNQEKKKVI